MSSVFVPDQIVAGKNNQISRLDLGMRSHYAILLAWSFDAIGGVNGVVRNLLLEFQTNEQLAPLGIDISGSVAGCVPASPDQPWPLLHTGPISTWNPNRPWRTIIAFCVKGPAILWRLRSICRRHSIAVLNPHFIGLEYFPLLILRKLRWFRGQLILSFHGSDIRSMMQSRGIERCLSKILLRGADQLVACSEGLRDEILYFVPECASRTVAIANGINARAFLSQAISTFPLPERFVNRKIILTIGAHEYKKGHDVLLRAFAIVKARHPETALVIVGQRNSAEVVHLGDELGLRDEMLALENIPHAEIAALMRRADLFVLSSRWERGICGEGFAMALLEAAAAEKQVVSTLTCGAAELLQDGRNGRLVPPNDPCALADAIIWMFENSQDALAMARRLHERVVTQFTWERTYAGYLRMLSM